MKLSGMQNGCEIVAVKKKKKRKKTNEVEMVNSMSVLSDAQNDCEIVAVKKKKKRKQKNEVQMANATSVLSDEQNDCEEVEVLVKKKKKSKLRNESEMANSISVLSDEENDCEEVPVKKKKKSKQRNEGEMANSISVLSDEENDCEELPVKKKKKSKQRNKAEMANSISVLSDEENDCEEVPVKKKKKSKQRNESEMANSTSVLSDEENDCEEVPVKKKKKSKQRNESEMANSTSVVSDVDDVSVTTPVQKQKKKDKTGKTIAIPEVSDVDDVSVTTSVQKKKKKDKTGKTIAISEVSDVDDVSVTTPVQKKKKKDKTGKTIAISEVSDVDDVSVTTPVQKRKKKDKTGKTIAISESNTNDVDCSQSPEVSLFTKVYSVVEEGRNEMLNQWNTTEKDLREAGIQFASGKWSQKEIAILKENVENVKLRHKIDDFQKFYSSVKEKTIESIPGNLYEDLGENLFRTVKQIRDKVNLMFMHVTYEDEEENVARFTLSEIEELIKLQKIFGNNWTLIGKKMGRSVKQLYKKWFEIRPVGSQKSIDPKTLIRTKTPFSSEEDKKLKEAVQKFGKSEVGGTMKVSDWNLIARAVGNNRSVKSCQQRWNIYLSCGFNDEKKKKMDNAILFFKMARILKGANIKDMNEVNWKDVIRLLNVDVPEHYIRKVFWNHLEVEYASQKEDNFVKALDAISNRYAYSSNDAERALHSYTPGSQC